MPTKVLIVEDHTLVSQGLVAMLSMVGGMELLGVATTGEEAVEKVQSEDVDVILMDVNLGTGISGIEATRQIKATFPDVRILILTMFTDPNTVSEAVKAGADGYLSKGSSRQAVVGAIEDVIAGRSVLDPKVTEGVFGRISDNDPQALNDKEVAVLQELSNGHSTKEISDHLTVSEDTVKGYLKQLFRKLKVSDRGEAVAEGFRRGLVH